MLIDTIYIVIAILSIVVIVSLFLKFKATQEKDNCYVVEKSTHPLHINNSCMELKDNLQLIRGIGKVLEKVLNDNGIYCFKQIANWTKEDVMRIDKLIAFPGRIAREQWIEQAKILISKKY